MEYEINDKPMVIKRIKSPVLNFNDAIGNWYDLCLFPMKETRDPFSVLNSASFWARNTGCFL